MDEFAEAGLDENLNVVDDITTIQIQVLNGRGLWRPVVFTGGNLTFISVHSQVHSITKVE